MERPGHDLQPSVRWLALAVGGVFFIEQLDTTILASVLPVMAHDFRVPPAELNLALVAYLISQCVYIPASGWLADRHGARRIFLTAILVFGAGSLLCAWAPTLGFLVAARVVQGIGGSMMLPVGRFALLRTAAPADRLRAMSIMLLPGMLGPALGPMAGGLIVKLLSWHWIFYVNIPVILVTLPLAWRFVPTLRAPHRRRFDWRGSALLSGGLILLVAGIEVATRPGAGAGAAGVLAGAVLLLALYVAHFRRARAPILDLDLLRIPSFGIAALGGTLFRVSYGVVPFLLPMMLHLCLGQSSLRSGVLVSVGTSAGLVMKGLATSIIARFGFRRVLLVNGGLSVVLLLCCAGLAPGTPGAVLLAVILAAGLARSLQFNAYGSIGYADVPPERMSAATAFNDMLQQFSLGIGVSLGALMLSGAAWLTGSHAPGLGDFSIAFCGAALVGASGVLACIPLPRAAGTALLPPHGGVRRTPEFKEVTS